MDVADVSRISRRDHRYHVQMHTSAGVPVSLARRRTLVALASALSLLSVPIVTSGASAYSPAPGAPTLAAASSGVEVSGPLPQASGSGDTPVETTEIDLVGVDAGAQAELETIDATSNERVAASVDPETDPGLEVENPLGVLPDAVSPEIITEKMSAEPFSVMGITWDLESSLDGVVVQYRTYQSGAWTDWGWVGATEEYAETADGSQASRGATDPIFVPDSTGVQLVVSASTGVPSGVKVVLIDPGNGPDGTGASTSSGDPADAGASAPAPTPSTTEDPAPLPSDGSPTGTPEPSEAPTAAPVPSPSPVETPNAPEPPVAPTDQPTEPAPSDSETPGADPTTALAPSGGERSGAGGSAALALRLPGATIAQPAMVSRAQWGAAAPVCQVDYGQELRAAAIHHTASTNNYSQAQVPGLLRGFAEFHMRPEAAGGRGWCDLGYNFLVDKFGTVYEGRGGGVDLPVVGVHTGGFNSRIVGVAAIGNYEEAVPSAAMNESLSRVIAWKLAQHRVSANTSVTLVSGGGASKYPAGTPVAFNTIFGHRDAQYTSCPGRYLYAAFGDIRNRVAELANPVVAESPEGAWDTVRGGGNSIRVTGWARDPSAPSSAVQVQILVGGVVRSTVSASNSRSDVGAHGYDASVGAAAGRHLVCLRYVNIGGGNTVNMGCRGATATASNPLGVLEAVSATSSSITVRGWARDPDSTAPINVHVYVDGKATRSVSANELRPDVERSAPGVAGPAHGFRSTVPASLGRHEVCIYGINVGAGSNTKIGCSTVVVANGAPLGSLDVVRAVNPDSFSVRGWALDPDTAASINVHVYVDGRAVRSVRADAPRPDVGRIYGLGDDHGFSATIGMNAGQHEVCVYAIDSSGGANPRIGCSTITIVNQMPIGNLDAAQGGDGRFRVRGWALDKDTTESITVHVFVDGRSVRSVLADLSRPDVGRVHGVGDAHGFDATLPAVAGVHEVCIFGIDSSRGPNPRLACSSVTVT